MKYNFDRVIDRKNTFSSKWDNADRRLRAHIELPLWVADMDFQVPIEVRRAVEKAAKLGIFGYSFFPEEYFTSMIQWFERRHAWSIAKDELLFCPGVVVAIRNLVQALTKPGDGIVIQPPVYPPFARLVTATGRRLLNNPLTNNGGRYEIDFEDLEKKLALNRTTMLILCNPHNPVGRAWTKRELTRLAKLSVKHDVFVVADEMHCDLIHEGYNHVPFVNISRSARMNSAICIAPGKSFNLAGLQMSSIVISDEEKRAKVKDLMHRRNGLDEPNLIGMHATVAAYAHGDEWLEQVLRYIRSNFEFMRDFLARKMPKVIVSELEATYLAWLDFRPYGLPHDEVRRRILDVAHVGINDGRTFGQPEGDGFFRINVACPRSILKQALERIVKQF